MPRNLCEDSEEETADKKAEEEEAFAAFTTFMLRC